MDRGCQRAIAPAWFGVPRSWPGNGQQTALVCLIEWRMAAPAPRSRSPSQALTQNVRNRHHPPINADENEWPIRVALKTIIRRPIFNHLQPSVFVVSCGPPQRPMPVHRRPTIILSQLLAFAPPNRAHGFVGQGKNLRCPGRSAASVVRSSEPQSKGGGGLPAPVGRLALSALPVAARFGQ